MNGRMARRMHGPLPCARELRLSYYKKDSHSHQRPSAAHGLGTCMKLEYSQFPRCPQSYLCVASCEVNDLFCMRSARGRVRFFLTDAVRSFSDVVAPQCPATRKGDALAMRGQCDCLPCV